jgi:hypothetical protein
MTTNLVTDVETLGIETLEFLASKVGIATLAAIVDVIAGGATNEMIVEELSGLIGALAQCVLTAIGPEKTRAALKVLFDAADKVVDAEEDAKFGPKP